MASEPDILKRRQAAAARAHTRMTAALIGYAPCGKLTVDDVLYIARLAQDFAFDASDPDFQVSE